MEEGRRGCCQEQGVDSQVKTGSVTFRFCHVFLFGLKFELLQPSTFGLSCPTCHGGLWCVGPDAQCALGQNDVRGWVEVE